MEDHLFVFPAARIAGRFALGLPIRGARDSRWNDWAKLIAVVRLPFSTATIVARAGTDDPDMDVDQ